jgi:hypothetical protein
MEEGTVESKKQRINEDTERRQHSTSKTGKRERTERRGAGSHPCVPQQLGSYYYKMVLEFFTKLMKYQQSASRLLRVPYKTDEISTFYFIFFISVRKGGNKTKSSSKAPPEQIDGNMSLLVHKTQVFPSSFDPQYFKEI